MTDTGRVRLIWLALGLFAACVGFVAVLPAPATDHHELDNTKQIVPFA